MKEYLSTADEVIKNLGTSEQGLGESEAEKRLAKHGANKLAEGKKESYFISF